MAVVGGGPAGCAAALELAARGARAVLLEREAVPRYKACGGGLTGRALAALPEGLDWSPDRTFRVAEMRLLDEDLRIEVTRPEPIVAMTMRAKLDGALFEAARRAGAEARSDCRLLDVSRRSDDLELATSRGTLRAGFLIAADGALGGTARRAGWPEAFRGLPALEGELAPDADAMARLGGAPRFDFGLPGRGYGWVFPKERHLSVGVLAARRGPLSPKALLRDYLRRVGLADRELSSLVGSAIPVRPRAGGLVRDRVLLAGDAAGLADPITGEGIWAALSSGRLAGRAWAEGGGEPRRVERLYERAVRREILRDLRAARALARVPYGPPRLQRFAFRRFGRGMCEALAEVIAGRRSYRGLLANPAGWLRLMRPG